MDKLDLFVVEGVFDSYESALLYLDGLDGNPEDANSRYVHEVGRHVILTYKKNPEDTTNFETMMALDIKSGLGGKGFYYVLFPSIQPVYGVCEGPMVDITEVKNGETWLWNIKATDAASTDGHPHCRLVTLESPNTIKSQIEITKPGLFICEPTGEFWIVRAEEVGIDGTIYCYSRKLNDIITKEEAVALVNSKIAELRTELIAEMESRDNAILDTLEQSISELEDAIEGKFIEIDGRLDTLEATTANHTATLTSHAGLIANLTTRLDRLEAIINGGQGTGGSNVTWVQLWAASENSQKIAQIIIDGTTYNVYAPKGGGSSITSGVGVPIMAFYKTENENEIPNAPTGGKYNVNEFEFEFSSIDADKWSTKNTAETGEIVWLSTNTYNSVSGKLSTVWSDPIRISGKNGTAGEDGETVEYIYCLSTTQNREDIDYPSANTAQLKQIFDSVENATNDPKSFKYERTTWYDRARAISRENNTEWAGARYKTNGPGADEDGWEYSDCFIWGHWGSNGTDGDGVEYIFKRTTDNTKPATPVAPSDTEIESIPAGWTDDPKGVGEDEDTHVFYEYEWVSMRTKHDEGEGGKWGDYSEPTIWAKYPYETFVSTCFTAVDSSLDLSNAVCTGGNFTDPYPTNTKIGTVDYDSAQITWTDGTPTVPTGKTLWMVAGRVIEGQPISWGNPVRAADNSYFNIEWCGDITSTVYANMKNAFQEEGNVYNLGYIYANNNITDNNPSDPHEAAEAIFRQLCSSNFGVTFSDTSDENTYYMATCSYNNGTWSNWELTKIKGEAGENGNAINLKGNIRFEIYQTIDEGKTEAEYRSSEYYTNHCKVENITNYIHDLNVNVKVDDRIVYFNVKWPEGQESTPYTGNDGSLNVYNWDGNYWQLISTSNNESLGIVTGDAYMAPNGHLIVWDGDSFVDAGVIRGEDGLSYKLYVKYANEDENGTLCIIDGDATKTKKLSFHSGTDHTTAQYIGTITRATTDTSNDLQDITKYAWYTFKGQDGFGYEYIFAVTATETAPVVPTRDTTDESYWEANSNEVDFVPKAKTLTDIQWSDETPSMTAEKPYLWMCWRLRGTDGQWSEFIGAEGKEGMQTLKAAMEANPDDAEKKAAFNGRHAKLWNYIPNVKVISRELYKAFLVPEPAELSEYATKSDTEKAAYYNTWKTNTAETEWSESKKYLFNVEELKQELSGAVSYTTPQIIAVWGEKGNQGVGIKELNEYYILADNGDDISGTYTLEEGKVISITKTGSGKAGITHWTKDTTESETNSVKISRELPFLWNIEEITWDDDAVTYTNPVVIAVYNEGVGNVHVDIDNEMDTIAVDSEGKTLYDFTGTFKVSAWTGITKINITDENQVDISGDDFVNSLARNKFTEVVNDDGTVTESFTIAKGTQIGTKSIKMTVTVDSLVVDEQEVTGMTTYTLLTYPTTETYSLNLDTAVIRKESNGSYVPDKIGISVIKTGATETETLSLTDIIGDDYKDKFHIHVYKDGGNRAELKDLLENGEFKLDTAVNQINEKVRFDLVVSTDNNEIDETTDNDDIVVDTETLLVVKDGESVYRLDLSNENASINADSSGAIYTSGFDSLSCTASVFLGTSQVSNTGITYSIGLSTDKGITIGEDGKLDFGNQISLVNAFGGSDLLEIPVKATIGSTTITSIMSLVRQKAATGLNIKGSYESLEELGNSVTNPSVGDLYIITGGTSGPVLYSWDGTSWVLAGEIQGTPGANGEDGKSIVWKGSLETAPTDPEEGWAYYNKTEGKSYIYNGSNWGVMTFDSVSYELVLDNNAAKYDKSGGTFNPTSIIIGAQKIVGAKNPTTLGKDDFSIKVKYDNASSDETLTSWDTTWNGYKLTLSKQGDDSPEYVTIKLMIGSESKQRDLETVIIVSDGKDGITGAIVRGPIVYKSSLDTRYFYDGKTLDSESGLYYLDIVTYNGTYYYCKSSYQHTKGSTANPSSDATHWKAADQKYDFVATNLLLADSAKIKFLTGNEIYLVNAENDSSVNAGIKGGTGINFWAGGSDPSTAAFSVKNDGTLKATKANITGSITATSLTLQSGVSINASNISGLDSKITSTVSGQGYITSADLSGYVTDSELASEINDVIGNIPVINAPSSTTSNGVTTTTMKIDGTSYTWKSAEAGKDYMVFGTSKGNGSTPGTSGTGTGTYFVVSKEGLLEANNAVIKGKIYAIDGEFTGKIKASEGYFGKINVSSSGEASLGALRLTNNGLDIYNGSGDSAIYKSTLINKIGKFTLPSDATINWNKVDGAGAAVTTAISSSQIQTKDAIVQELSAGTISVSNLSGTSGTRSATINAGQFIIEDISANASISIEIIDNYSDENGNYINGSGTNTLKGATNVPVLKIHYNNEDYYLDPSLWTNLKSTASGYISFSSINQEPSLINNISVYSFTSSSYNPAEIITKYYSRYTGNDVITESDYKTSGSAWYGYDSIINLDTGSGNVFPRKDNDTNFYDSVIKKSSTCFRSSFVVYNGNSAYTETVTNLGLSQIKGEKSTDLNYKADYYLNGRYVTHTETNPLPSAYSTTSKTTGTDSSVASTMNHFANNQYIAYLPSATSETTLYSNSTDYGTLSQYFKSGVSVGNGVTRVSYIDHYTIGYIDARYILTVQEVPYQYSSGKWFHFFRYKLGKRVMSSDEGKKSVNDITYYKGYKLEGSSDVSSWSPWCCWANSSQY